MKDILSHVGEAAHLGRDFLIWLWFMSDTHGETIPVGTDETVELAFDGLMTLKADGDQGEEVVSCLGTQALSKEARFALSASRKIAQARLRLRSGDDTWSFVLDSTWMNFRGFKTPVVARQDAEDPDGLFFEKLLLLEHAVGLMDRLYERFLELRRAPDWESGVLPALRSWIREGRSTA